MFRCAAFLLLHRLFSSRNEHKILLIALHRFLIAVASFVAKHRLKNTELQQLWHTGSIVAVPKSSRAQAQSVQFSSVQSLSHVQLCDSMNHSTPGLPVHHHLLEFTQTHIHRVGDAIQPSQPVVPFSSCLQSRPASESFPMSQLFA